MFWQRSKHRGTSHIITISAVCLSFTKQKLCRQILDKMFISSRHKFMPSRPLLISPIHRVNSSSCQVISLSRRVISSCRLYYLQVHYSYILQWFFNSACRTSTHRSLYPYILAIVWTRGLSLQVKPSGPRDENKRRPGHQRQDKRTAQAHVLPVLRKMDEVNVVKDILRGALSRIDQIPSQSSQSQSGNPSQQQNLPVSTNNDSLLSRAQNNFR